MGAKRAPGNSRVSCAIRRTLLVPIDGAWPSAATSSSMRRRSVACRDGLGRKHDRVVRILARQHGGDAQAVGQDGRHVLAAVDGEIDLVAEQRVLDFLDEQPLAADLRERRVLQPIAGGLDDDDAARGSAGSRDRGRRRRSPATAPAGCRACRVEAPQGQARWLSAARAFAGLWPLRASRRASSGPHGERLDATCRPRRLSPVSSSCCGPRPNRRVSASE